MKKLFILSILLILLLVTLVNIIGTRKIQKTINRLKEQKISCITVIHNNTKIILTDENIIYEIVNNIDNILTVKQDDLNQSFMRGDTQDVIEFIIITQKKENIKITFAYSYSKELCRISISTESSAKCIYKVINLSEETYMCLVEMINEKNKF